MLQLAWSACAQWCASELVFFSVSVLFSFWATFWTFHGILLAIDGSSSGLEQFRLQCHRPRLNASLQPKVHWKVIRKTIVNQLLMFVSMPLLYYLLRLRGMSVQLPFPPAWQVVLHVTLFVLAEDALFFWSHYLLHRVKYLNRHVHSVHHHVRGWQPHA